MGSRNSLRIEFLFNLAFLATGAFLLAFWTARTLEGTGAPVIVITILAAAAVAAFILVGNYLIDRWVLRPLAAIARSASAIGGGDYEQRVPEKGPEEIASLARALNHLTDELLHKQDRLAENVRSLDETNRRLTEAQVELVQAEKMASVGQLAAGIAHEIGNPLGAILGYVSLQKRRGGDPELIDGLEREAKRIDRIVRGLIDYARPGNAVREPLDVNSSIHRVVNLLREQGWLAGVEVDLDLAEPLPSIVADPHRVDQIFVNLLRNAESAMNGKGRIAISTSRQVVTPGQSAAVRRADDPPEVNYSHLRRARDRAARATQPIERPMEVVHVSVSDSGPGIPAENLSAVFDPFFTTKDPGEGTGLGLAIVAGTVAELGGRIEASTSSLGGAMFSLWLPTSRGAE